MVTTRSRTSLSPPPPPEIPKLEGDPNEEGGRGSPPGSPLSPPQTPPSEALDASAASPAAEGYESLRDRRIKENLQRMKELGILDLSLQLKSQRPALSDSTNSCRHRRKRATPDAAVGGGSLRSPVPARRSSRLQNIAPVSYTEAGIRNNGEPVKRGSIVIEEGAKEEIYTDEHEKLLGTCNSAWTLFVDGYGKDGRRIYDNVKGKTCHQCRQKTLGHRTHCCKCQIVQGQFCGDCLLMRYGENVLEAKQNPNWICPVCRGICNCSLCRIKKGWAPTGAMYKKVQSLGYKSVAHYLIHTRRSQPKSEDLDFVKPTSSRKSLTFVDAEDGPNHESRLELDGMNSVSKDENASDRNEKTELLISDENGTSIVAEEKVTSIKSNSDGIASRLRKRHKP